MATRRDYTRDSTLRGRVFELLDVVFPGLAQAERSLRPLGLDWQSVSTPFVIERDGRVLSHVGVIELTESLDGVLQPVGSIHAVGTHPEHRRRGLFRRVFDEVLAHCDERYATLQLTTANPEYYEPFGFRRVPEHRFVADCQGALPRVPSTPRSLDVDRPADRELLLALLDGRGPASLRLGVAQERAAFLFNWARKPLAYLEQLETIVAYEREGATLRLIDVVSQEELALDELVAWFDAGEQPVQRVELYFTPDRFESRLDLEPQPFLIDGDDHLMVRGPFPALPLMLPRTART